MRGAVAGGHPLTAEAGARVLEAGGNAVDAAVGAALVSWVAESPLTGPGAGGFMLVHRARDRSTRVFDFFVAIPGLGDERDLEAMHHVDVDFSGGSAPRLSLRPAAGRQPPPSPPTSAAARRSVFTSGLLRVRPGEPRSGSSPPTAPSAAYP